MRRAIYTATALPENRIVRTCMNADYILGVMEAANEYKNKQIQNLGRERNMTETAR